MFHFYKTHASSCINLLFVCLLSLLVCLLSLLVVRVQMSSPTSTMPEEADDNKTARPISVKGKGIYQMESYGMTSRSRLSTQTATPAVSVQVQQRLGQDYELHGYIGSGSYSKVSYFSHLHTFNVL